MTIHWITPLLGTAPAEEVQDLTDIKLIDVRDLVDKAGNRPDAVREKIMAGVNYLESGDKTIVCCDYGISRSNALAAGIFAVYNKLSFAEAVKVVQETTGEKEIKLELLDVVRRSIESKVSATSPKGINTVLVTGARGFVGTALCKRLGNDYQVIAPSRLQLDIQQGNTQLSLLVGQHNVDCIIHLANPRVYTSNVALGETLTMLRNVLDVCMSHDIPLIYPSGWEIYSGYSGTLVADEALPAFPCGPYGETKYLAELMIAHWQRTTDIRCAILRSSPVYGTGSRKPKFIYNFMEKAKRSEPIITHRYLNGNPALDLLHIDDFVDSIVRVYKHQYVGALNIGTGILTSTWDIAEKLRNDLGSNSRIEQTQIETYTACVAMNYQKANRILGWHPRVTLNEGLRSLLTET